MKTSISFPACLLLILALLACAPDSYAKPKKKDHPKTALNQIMETGPTITGSIITPIGDRHLSEVSANITSLREKVLDEGAKAPVATPETYKAAADLCDGWLNALNDRHNIYMAQYKTHAMSRTDAKETNFFDDAEKKEWLDHAARWHIYLDQLYARLAALRRQPLQPKVAAAPAPAAATAPVPTATPAH